MKEKYYVTIREIHEFADKVAKERPDRVDVETYDFINSHGCAKTEHVFDSVFYPECADYRVEVELSENGHIVAHAYDYQEMEKYFNEWAALRVKYEFDEITFEEFLEKEPERPEEKFHFDVPLTRGYSDISTRKDTELTHLDVDCAIEEYIREKEGKQKIYPWMIKELMPASDFGVSEEEYDTLLQDTLG